MMLQIHRRKKIGSPRNSTLYAWLSHNACVPIQHMRYFTDESHDNDKRGMINGRNNIYHRKYCEVQTLLKITKIAVWMNHPMIMSRLVRMKKRPELRDRDSCVRKLVKGERITSLHTDDCVAAVEMPG